MLVQGFLALRAAKVSLYTLRLWALAHPSAKLFEDKRARFTFYLVVGSGITIGLFGSTSYVAVGLISHVFGDSYNPPMSYNIVIGVSDCFLLILDFTDPRLYSAGCGVVHSLTSSSL